MRHLTTLPTILAAVQDQADTVAARADSISAIPFVPPVVNEWLTEHPVAGPAIGLGLLALVAWITNVFAKRRLLKLAERLIARSKFTWDDALGRHKVLERLANLAPAIVVYYGITLVPGPTELIQNVTQAFMVVVLVVAGGGLLAAANDIYSQRTIGRWLQRRAIGSRKGGPKRTIPR